MYELSIKNFQSIEEQTLKLKGFVAITGPSNLGKSSIRRAFGSVLYNDWDSTWQRNHWHKKPKPTVVTFKTPNDVSVSMRKCGYEGYNEFILNTHLGETKFNKVGQKCPEEIGEEGFKLLNLGDEELNLQIAKQLDTLFVVAYKPATNTKILNKVFNVSKLELASQMVVRDAKNIKKDMNDNTKQYNEKTAQLEDLESKYSSLKEKYDRALFLFNAIEQLEEYENSISHYQEIDESIEREDLTLDVGRILLSKLESVVSINEFLELLEKDDDVCQKLDDENHNLTKLNSYKDKCNSALDISEYLNQIHEMSMIDLDIDSLDEHKDFFDRFESNKNLCNFIYWTEQVSKVDEMVDLETKSISTLAVHVASYSNVELAANYCVHIDGITDLDDKIADVDKEIEELNKELESMPRCDKCGQLWVH